MIGAGRTTAAVVLLLLCAAACGRSAPEGAAPAPEPGRTSPSASDAPPSTPPTAATPVPEPTAAPAPSSGPAATSAVPATRWRPEPGTTWQYQLDGRLDTSVDAAVFDVDWEDTTAAQVRELHDRGRRVICYVNAGAYEEWRGDAGSYPADVLGDPLDGWPGERWLDIRRLDVLLPILAARLDACRDKGFDAVEADNVDGYANDTGFPLSAQDQLDFNTAVARLAHERGLSIGLKNDVEQIGALEPVFDFAVNEECLAYDECDAYAPFLAAGKAVLHVEYEPPSAAACARASSLGMSTIVKDLDLGSELRHC